VETKTAAPVVAAIAPVVAAKVEVVASAAPAPASAPVSAPAAAGGDAAPGPVASRVIEVAVVEVAPVEPLAPSPVPEAAEPAPQDGEDSSDPILQAAVGSGSDSSGISAPEEVQLIQLSPQISVNPRLPQVSSLAAPPANAITFYGDLGAL
jgi:hypothetical protein